MSPYQRIVITSKCLLLKLSVAHHCSCGVVCFPIPMSVEKFAIQTSNPLIVSFLGHYQALKNPWHYQSLWQKSTDAHLLHHPQPCLVWSFNYVHQYIDWFKEAGLTGQFMWRYLMHMPGNGYSARLKYLLMCGSPVIFPYGGLEEFWYHLLEVSYYRHTLQRQTKDH